MVKRDQSLSSRASCAPTGVENVGTEVRTMNVMGVFSSRQRSVWLIQLPIPPLGPEPIRGNVPLAAAYLKLWAEKKGLGSLYDIHIFPAAEANSLGDRALVAAIAAREPWLIGFTCYVWNIERTLWIARELKRLRP